MRRGWMLAPDGERTAVRFEGSPRLAVNNSFAVRDALLKSLGVGLLPLLVAQEPLANGRLVPVLPQWRALPVEVHAVYPSSRYLSPKVRAFIDLALERFPAAAEGARAAVQTACPAPPAARPRRRARTPA
jgi:DNA-binding transcriptional LysR family regulator